MPVCVGGVEVVGLCISVHVCVCNERAHDSLPLSDLPANHLNISTSHTDPQ